MSSPHCALFNICVTQNDEELLTSQKCPVALFCHHTGTSTPLFCAVDQSHDSNEP